MSLSSARMAAPQLVAAQELPNAMRPTEWPTARPAGRLVIDADGWIVECDRAAAASLGLIGDDARIDLRRVLRAPVQFDEWTAWLSMTGRIEGLDADLIRLDGRPAHLLVDLEADFDETRSLTSIVAHLHDIRDWVPPGRRTPDDSVEAAQVTGRVAHEFNNLLTVLGAHLEYLVDCTPESDGWMRSASAIKRCSESAAGLTRDLLGFSRRLTPRASRVDTATLLRSIGGSLQRTFGRRIPLSIEVDESLPPVRVDRARLERAIGSLAANAIAALDGGGALTLRAEPMTATADGLVAVKPGRYVRFELACAGLDADAAADLAVTPHYTAIASALKSIGGALILRSDRTLQPSFSLFVAADSAAIELAPVAPLNTGTVVVVDDDGEVRDLIVKVLRHEGYTVFDTGSASEAAELCTSRGADVLVCDHVLDGARGEELAASLLERDERLRVLCISGYPRDAESPEFDPARASFLQKPFSSQALTRRVRHLLTR